MGAEAKNPVESTGPAATETVASAEPADATAQTGPGDPAPTPARETSAVAVAAATPASQIAASPVPTASAPPAFAQAAPTAPAAKPQPSTAPAVILEQDPAATAPALDLGQITPERDASLVGANPDHDGSPTRLGWLGTLAGHITLAALILAAPAPEAHWAGGSDGDGIDVDIVSSRQLADSVTSRARPDQAPSVPSAAEAPPQPPPKPEQTALLEQPDTPDPRPDPDAVTLDVAPEIAPPKPIETADEKPAPTPEPTPPRTDRAPERTDPPAPAADASSGAQDRIASNVTGAARLGTVAALTVRASQGEIAAYSRTILETLDRAKPRLTRGLTGTVSISFVIDETGSVGRAYVDRTSGSSRLDALALESVKSARFPAPPAGLAEPDRFYRIPITFR